MSHQERDLEIGRLVREHGDRRREYMALSAKLNRIGASLQEVAKILTGVDVNYSQSAEAAKTHLQTILQDVDLAALLRLLENHIQLAQKLQIDLNTLREYGIEK